VPVIVRADDLARLTGRTVLVVTPHADDPALFCGGTLAAMSGAGAHLVHLRVTRDETDSVGLSPAETARRNGAELADAHRALGIAERVDLGYDSDRMSDVPETQLREHLIRAVRTFRPFAVVTFDPYSAFGEDNQDHVRTAQAMDEAFWTAMFDKHHPEHTAEGLEPHGVVERWYFGRRLLEVTHVIDIAGTVGAKADAAAAHRTMMGHMVHQLRLMARTDDRTLSDVDALIADPTLLVRAAVEASATRVGEPYGLAAAEEFRVVRFAGMEALVDVLDVAHAGQGIEEVR
jgi:LmbE family N-acetylglucosaminyl deacetylase